MAYVKKLKHISKEEKKWAYDRFCEGYTHEQIAEALGVSFFQVRLKLKNLPRIRPILHYTPKAEEKNAKEIILQMATIAQNSKRKGEQGHLAFTEEQQQRYGKEILDLVTALFNAGYRKESL